MSTSQTVRVEPLDALPALLMVWSAHPKKLDIDVAFQTIAKSLTTSHHPLFIIIDLTNNLSLPISEILNTSLNGAYQNPKFAAALIIGGHQRARSVANMLQHITRQNKIQWFKDEDEAYNYIRKQCASNGS